MTEWQPIETAPKDGTPILIHRAESDFPLEEAFHVVRWDAFFDDEPKWWQVHDGKNDHPLRGPEPTHWRALESPPVGPKDDASDAELGPGRT